MIPLANWDWYQQTIHRIFQMLILRLDGMESEIYKGHMGQKHCTVTLYANTTLTINAGAILQFL